MVVDELVTLLQFDLPPQSRTALSGVDKAIGGITGKLKSLGIVSMVTSGVFAAFSVNAAREATSLANLSDAIGVSKKEIQSLGAVYKQLGGDAKTFASDAAAFKATTGNNLDLDKMVELSRTFSSLSNDAAYRLGQAYGFSNDMIRVLRQGPDALRAMAKETAEWHTLTENATKNLEELDKQWASTSGITSAIAGEVQGAFAPELTNMLKDFTEFLKENKADIISGAEEIAKGLGRAWNTAKEAGRAAADALKPVWDVLNQFVKEHGGWAEAIKNVTLVLAAISVPAGLAGSIGALAAVIGGLGTAATATAGILGTGGVFLAAFSAAAIIVSMERKSISAEIEALTADFEKMQKKTKAVVGNPSASIGEITGVIKEAGEVADKNSGSWKAAIPVVGSPTITGSIQAIKDWRERGNQADQSYDELVAALSPSEKHYLARNSDDLKLRKYLQDRGWGDASEIASETRTASVRRPTIAPQRGDAALFDSIADAPSGAQGTQNSLTTNQTTFNLYQIGSSSSMAEAYRATGGMANGISASQ